MMLLLDSRMFTHFQEHQTCDINIAKDFLALLINKFLQVKSIPVCHDRHCEDATLASDQIAQSTGGVVNRSYLGRLLFGHSTERLSGLILMCVDKIQK